jgi:hypothetical protein
LLAVVGVYLVHGGGGETMLVFNLVDVEKAMAWTEQSSCASQEAIAQLVQVTDVEEAFLEPCLCWLVG